LFLFDKEKIQTLLHLNSRWQRSIDKSCNNQNASLIIIVGGVSLPQKKTTHTHRSLSAGIIFGSLFMDVLTGGGVGSAFKHLQPIVSSGSSRKLTSNCSIQTKTDAKFEATKHLLLTTSQLLGAANVLDEYVKVISSDESSCYLINKKSQHVKSCIVAMILYTANSVINISKNLAPIPSVNYVLRRMESKRKSEVVDKSSNSCISPDFQLCPKPFTGVEEHCLGKSTRVGADYQYVMKN
jgi:hypothetical protein